MTFTRLRRKPLVRGENDMSAVPSPGEILNDRQVVDELLSDLVISPIISADQIGPTVDLRLGAEFVVKKMNRLPYYDLIDFHKKSQLDGMAINKYYETVKILQPTTPFILHPGQFALGSTLEFVRLPPNIGAQLEGRSGWAREGLNVHSTAGLIHPGHEGVIVFELQNLGTHPLPLFPGTRVAQLLFYRLRDNSRRPYSAKEGGRPNRYVGTVNTAFGRPWEEWEFECLSKMIRPEGGSPGGSGQPPPSAV